MPTDFRSLKQEDWQASSECPPDPPQEQYDIKIEQDAQPTPKPLKPINHHTPFKTESVCGDNPLITDPFNLTEPVSYNTPINSSDLHTNSKQNQYTMILSITS